MTRRIAPMALLTAAAIALAACDRPQAEAEIPVAQDEPEAVDAGAAPLQYEAAAVEAVADPRRPAQDREEDGRRKPVDALIFAQIEPGMTVFEMEAGGGWYTELFSHLVGGNGEVVMQNPEGFLAFLGERIAARLQDGRLANVRQSISNFDALDAPDASIDVVTWVQGPHELYFSPAEGVTLGDPATAYAEIFRILKPGGVFVAIDHSAESGAPETTGHDLHRIDKAIVTAMAERAGLVLEAESGFLRNPADPLAIGVFDASIRGRTDQFALRFRKAA